MKTVQISESPTEKLLNSTSCWIKLKRRIAWFLRLKSFLFHGNVTKGPLSINDMRNSETSIIQYIQAESFSTTILSIKSNSNLSRTDILRKLDPFLDQKTILRVGGRLHHSSLHTDSKHPIILPNKNCHVIKLIQHTHKMLGHTGRRTLATYLRNRYWILGINSMIRTLQYNCVSCRKYNASPRVPKMSTLPPDRVSSDKPAFTHTGVDYFGPFDVTNGRKHEKRYGVIFTCLSSRAVHLEMAHSLSTDGFINAFRRFVARRGNVSFVRSDNGTNLTSGCKELRECLDNLNQEKLCHWMTCRNLEWVFQPPSASHFGGAFEREIRCVRKVLNGILTEQPLKLTDEQLNTLLCEVESILNCRPLTELSSDKDDLNALTPNHLLLLHAGATFPPGLFSKDDSYAKRRWKQVQYLCEIFWSRFRREYLPLLQQRQKWFNNNYNLKENDLVLLTDQMLPRNQWSLGRIVKVYPDSEGNVRVVRVKIAKYKSKKTDKNSLSIVELDRPVSKLILVKSIDTT